MTAVPTQVRYRHRYCSNARSLWPASEVALDYSMRRTAGDEFHMSRANDRSSSPMASA